MKPALTALVGATVLLLLVILLPASASARTFPTRIQVTAKEYYYTLSSRTVKSGTAVIQFVNYGEDPHDMRVERVGGTRTYSTPIMQPGGIYNMAIKLLPGRYELWCSIANHRELGMEATLIVKPAG